MRADIDTLPCAGRPAFLERTEILRGRIAGMPFAEQKRLWACNDKIARENAERFAGMDLSRGLTPALLAYDGIQYTYMAPAVFSDGEFAWVQAHLRILSGFYGVLCPLDGVVPYRLEMQAKLSAGGAGNLYEFWGDTLYRAVMDESRVLVNLASKEYFRCIEPYLREGDRCVTCVFGEEEGGKIVQKGVYAKMARGRMVRFAAETGAESPERLRAFAQDGYRFDAARSTETEYVFLRSGR